MRHYKKGRKLGTDASHTKAIKKSLIANLFLNDRIKTTLERAKEIRGDVDRVITWAKRGDVHSRRLAIAKLGDKDLVAEIFSKVAQGMFEGRPGGYSRIMRLGMRRGDSATIVIMELVQEPVSKKTVAADDGKAASKAGDGKASAKKSVDDKKPAADIEGAADADVGAEAAVAGGVDEVIEAEVVEAAEKTEVVAVEVAAAEGVADATEAVADSIVGEADEAVTGLETEVESGDLAAEANEEK